MTEKIVNTGNSVGCVSENEIVSYLYDEMPRAARTRFERHLVDCSLCTDEFADISDARFSMYEWNREEFVNIPTPKIAIPYRPVPLARSEESSNGFFEGIRAWLSLVNIPVAFASGLVVIFAVGFLAISLAKHGEKQVTFVAPTILQSVESVKEVESAKEIKSRDTAQVKSADHLISKLGSDDNKTGRVAMVAHHRGTVLRHSIIAENTKKTGAAMIASSAPRLSSDDNSDDDSLRLADLLDDVDG